MTLDNRYKKMIESYSEHFKVSQQDALEKLIQAGYNCFIGIMNNKNRKAILTRDKSPRGRNFVK